MFEVLLVWILITCEPLIIFIISFFLSQSPGRRPQQNISRRLVTKWLEVGETKLE